MLPSANALRRLVHALPKVELHVHLEGSMTPRVAARLARRHGVTLPSSVDERAWVGVDGFRDFEAFAKLYLLLSSCVHDGDDVLALIDDVSLEMAAQNIRHAEMTFTPWTHVARGVAVDELVRGLVEGRAHAKQVHGVELRYVFDIVRCFADQAEPTLDFALRVARSTSGGVVGLGLGGPESRRWPAGPFARVFARARASGLHSLPHAGELDGPASMWEALDVLGAERIGHGIRCLEDPTLVDALKHRGVALEVCPTSNVMLAGIPELAAHPLPNLAAAGLEFSLGTDDPALFSTSLASEYLAAAQLLGLSPPEIVDLAGNAVRHSFLSAAEKHVLITAQADAHAEWLAASSQ